LKKNIKYISNMQASHYHGAFLELTLF